MVLSSRCAAKMNALYDRASRLGTISQLSGLRSYRTASRSVIPYGARRLERSRARFRLRLEAAQRRPAYFGNTIVHASTS